MKAFFEDSSPENLVRTSINEFERRLLKRVTEKQAWVMSP